MTTQYNIKNWMASLPDTLKLSELSIPGTHDTMTFQESDDGWVRCQTKNIEEQFNLGIRFFDIRLVFPAQMAISDQDFPPLISCHGDSWFEINFNQIIEHLQTLLHQNPTECIIVSIKNEAGNAPQAFADLVRGIINCYEDIWYHGNIVPTLHDVRGKAVLLRRYSGTTFDYGLNFQSWKSEANYEHSGDGISYSIQDEYDTYTHFNEESKYDNYVKPQLERALSDNGKDKIYINFLSGTGTVWPSTLAEVTNLKTLEYMRKAPLHRFGIIPCDYPQNHGDDALTLPIIKTNKLKDIVVGQVYTISPKHATNTVLDVFGINKDNGARICINSINGGLNQQWKVEDAGEGYVYLSPQHAPDKVLTSKEIQIKDGSAIETWTNEHKDTQKWKIVRQAEGFYTICPKLNLNFTLDVLGGGTGDGTNVGLFHIYPDTPSHQAYGQRWIFF